MIAPLVPWIINGLVIVQILLYGVTALVLRRSSPGGRSASELISAAASQGLLRGLLPLRLGAVALASFPAATFLANLLPWWRARYPSVMLAGAVVLFIIVFSALALLGPWRRAVLGPLAVVAALTAGVFTVDAVTGSHLMISSLLAVQPIVSGRFSGFSNTVLALIAIGVLLTAITVADRLTKTSDRKEVANQGADQTQPRRAVLALLAAGTRFTWQRALLIAAVTIALLFAVAVTILAPVMLNDSGTVMLAYAGSMVIPLLVVAWMPVSELQNGAGQRPGRPDPTSTPASEDLRAPVKGRGRRLLAGGVVLVLITAGSGGWSFHRSLEKSEPLNSAVVAIGANGKRVSLPGQPPLTPLIPGSRVLVSAGPAGQLLAAEQRQWLAAGRVPGGSAELRDLARTALLDLNTLEYPNGAVVAGWPSSWRYVWPRDASMIAVALSHAGHGDDALRIMQFLQRMLPPSGVFQARYLPDGSGVPDARGEQTDGTGWVLWAVTQMIKDLPAGSEQETLLSELRPLIEGSTRAALRITDRPGGLPKASLDYWEIWDDRLTLGTAAPLAFGLEAAAKLQRALGATELSQALEARAGLLRTSIRERFGKYGYSRYLDGGDPDASVAFLLPPFTDRADPEIVEAWRKAARRMVRPAGGLAPGASWWNGSVSWTPPTALFALAAASSGDRPAAERWLTWLANHRTPYGALPEKVLSNGDPSGPAPLAWTGAIALLAIDALED